MRFRLGAGSQDRRSYGNDDAVDEAVGQHAHDDSTSSLHKDVLMAWDVSGVEA